MLKKILVVEDDVMLAMDIAAELEGYGFSVVGPCVSTKDALRLFESENCDAAILDINLGAETSEAIAHALKHKGIPFVVTSGYTRAQYPAVFSDAPALSKPIQTEQLIALLNEAA